MGEQNFYCIEDGKIFANATKWSEKRFLTNVPEKNQEHTIAFLKEKFEELDKEVTLLLHEYKNAENKLKLAGKINRQKNYILNAKAIGDYSQLILPLEELEQELLQIIETNIEERNKIIAKAEGLVQSEGDWKSKTTQLNELVKEMKAMPVVPDVRVEETRKKLDEIKDQFFMRKSKFYEESEAIILDNLAHKLEICEKAEALSDSTEWKATSEKINQLNEEWKSIGPVPRHKNEELWARFNEAKEKFFARKKEFFSDLKVAQEENLKVKNELIEKAEALKDSRDWKKTTDEFNKLMEEWKKSGPVAQEIKDEVWNRFNEAKNTFFTAKDQYYSSIKLNLEDNYARKMALVLRTEELADMASPDWDEATQEMLDMMEDWKKIGRIPKEYGDEPWERFLAAKKKFFDRKDEERQKRRAEGSKSLSEKIKRNRGYYNKLSRELELEQEVLFDFSERLKNLAPSIRSFETKERYELIIADAEKKVNFLKGKLKEIKNNLDADEKELRFISRPFKKKENDKENSKENKIDAKAAESTSSQEINNEDAVNDSSQEISPKTELQPDETGKATDIVSDDQAIEVKSEETNQKELIHFDEHTENKEKDKPVDNE